MLGTWRGWLINIDRQIYDTFIRQHDIPLLDRILIVGIDLDSLEQLGRWPFPRRYHAELLNRISRGRPAVVGMDIQFSEPDIAQPENDRQLVQAVAKNAHVVLPVVLEQYRSKDLQEGLPFPQLREVVAGLGHVDTELEADGIARSVFLKAGLDRPRWPMFSLAMAQVAGYWKDQVPLLEKMDAPVYVTTSKPVWRRFGQVLVPFTGADHPLPVVSYADVLSGKIPPEQFADKFVFVGAIATGMGDTVPTPISALGQPVAGVEYNAYAFNALLQDQLVIPVASQWQYVLNALAILLLLIFYRPDGWRWIYSVILLLLGVLAIDYLLLAKFAYWYPPSIILFGIMVFFLFQNEQRLRRVLRLLFTEREQSQAALTVVGDGVLHLDFRGHIQKANPKAEQLSGLPRENLLDRYIGDVFRIRFHSGERFTFRKYLNSGKLQTDQPLLLKNVRGDEYRVRLAFNKLRGDDEGDSIVMVLSDVSREHALVDAVAYRETHNRLTDLPNYELTTEQLGKAIQQCRQTGGKVVVVHIDVDKFSRINETEGIEYGDLLLQSIANRLRHGLGQQMFLGHMGGDEFFLVIQDDKDRKPVEMLISSIFFEFSRPFEILDRELNLSVTLGVSIFPDHAEDANTLLALASIAMHRGKKNGGGQIVYYEPGMQHEEKRLLEIESLLQSALKSDGLGMVFQPIIDVGSMKIVGVEVLARMQDAKGHFISPEVFIAVAEQTGMIADIGFQQLRNACEQLSRWKRQGHHLRLSYNFSPRQMETPGLVRRIEEILVATGTDASDIDFEVTENLLLSDEAGAKTRLRRIRTLGIGLVIDDFGTGYNAIGYLARFDFQRLKIDKMFVSELCDETNAWAIVANTINMAHELGMKVVAEGVESVDQFEALRKLGCDEMQGFLFCKPLSAAALEEYLSDYEYSM